MSTDSLGAAAAFARPVASLTALHWTGVALAAVTGGIHLWLGVTASKPPLAVAGVGFATGIAAVGLDVRRRSAVATGLPFVAGQIALYALGHGVVGPRALSVAPPDWSTKRSSWRCSPCWSSCGVGSDRRHRSIPLNSIIKGPNTFPRRPTDGATEPPGTWLILRRSRCPR